MVSQCSRPNFYTVLSSTQNKCLRMQLQCVFQLMNQLLMGRKISTRAKSYMLYYSTLMQQCGRLSLCGDVRQCYDAIY